MLASTLLSPATKWKIARDAFGTTSAPEIDESVAAFVRRKFGAELLDRLVALSSPEFTPAIRNASVCAAPSRNSMMPRNRRQRDSRLDASRKIAERAARAPNAAQFSRRERCSSTRTCGETGIEVASRRRSPWHCDSPEAGAPRFELRLRQAGNEEILIADRLVMATPRYGGVLLRDVNAAFEPVLAASSMRRSPSYRSATVAKTLSIRSKDLVSWHAFERSPRVRFGLELVAVLRASASRTCLAH